jgi:hypothetical protein
MMNLREAWAFLATRWDAAEPASGPARWRVVIDGDVVLGLCKSVAVLQRQGMIDARTTDLMQSHIKQYDPPVRKNSFRWPGCPGPHHGGHLLRRRGWINRSDASRGARLESRLHGTPRAGHRYQCA